MCPFYLQLALFGIAHPAHKPFDQSPVNILLIKYKKNLTRPRNISFLLALEPYWLQFNFTIPNIRKFMFQRYGVEVLPQWTIRNKKYFKKNNISKELFENLAVKGCRFTWSLTIFHEGRKIIYIVHNFLWVYHDAWRLIVQLFSLMGPWKKLRYI